MGVSFHKDGFWTRNGSGVVGSGNFCLGPGIGALADPLLKIAVLELELVELVLNFWIIKELFWANPLRELLLDREFYFEPRRTVSLRVLLWGLTL